MPFVGPDEPRYAQVAREMFERNDFVTPTLGGHTWFEKPALLYWLMIAGFYLFGVTEWAARVGSAVAGIATVAAVAWLTQRIERKRDDERKDEEESASNEERRSNKERRSEEQTVSEEEPVSGEERGSLLALVTACVTASSIGLIVFAHAASFDIIVTATVAWTLAFFFAADTAAAERERNRFLCLMYVSVGIGLLAKGLVGVVVPGVVCAFYYLLQRRLPARRVWWSLAWGAIVVSLVAGVWYAPVIWLHGRSFLDEFFLQHHFARYTTNKYRHPQPFYFYIPIMLALALPWTLVLLAALAEMRGGAWRGEDVGSRLRIFSFAWLIAPLVFFSASGSKLPGYALPALPGAALLVGEYLTRRRRSGRNGKGSGEIFSLSTVLRLTGGGLVLTACGGALFAALTGEASWFRASFVAAPIALGGLYLLRRTRDVKTSIAVITTTTLLAVFLAVAVAGEAAERYSSRGLLRAAAVRGLRSEPLYGLYMFDRTAEFYAADRVVYDLKGEPLIFDSVNNLVELVRRLDAEQGDRPAVLVFTFPDTVSHIKREKALDAEVVGDNGHVALVSVRKS